MKTMQDFLEYVRFMLLIKDEDFGLLLKSVCHTFTTNGFLLLLLLLHFSMVVIYSLFTSCSHGIKLLSVKGLRVEAYNLHSSLLW